MGAKILGLRILPTAVGRRIVPDDPGLEQFVSKDKQAFDKGDWRVRLKTCYSVGQGLRRIVAIDYRDPQAKPETKRIGFSTGHLELSCLDMAQVDGKQITSRIQLDYEEYPQVLAKTFDIRSGYCFETPNQDWTSTDDHPTKLATDGAIILIPSGPSVEGATWAVACSYSVDDPHNASITLYTEEEDLDKIMRNMEAYLKEHDMSDFGDLLSLPQ